MKLKVLAVVCILLFSAVLIPISSVNAENIELSSEATYTYTKATQTGLVSIKGSVPAEYSIVDFDILKPNGESISTGYAVANANGSFERNVSVMALEEADGYVIKFRADGKTPVLKFHCTFNVSKDMAGIPVNSISIPESISVIEGKTEIITVTFNPNNASFKDIVWKSDDTSIATVDGGVIKGVKTGTTNISATSVDGGKTDSCIVTVTKDPRNIVVSPNDLKLYLMGGASTATITANLTDIEESDLTWITDSSTKVKFLIDGSQKDSVSGLRTVTVMGLEEGSVSITAYSGDISDTCSIYVSGGMKPDDTPKEYTFNIKMNTDAEKVSHATYTQNDLKSGIEIKGTGINAADALEDACENAKIPLKLIYVESNGQTLKGWIDKMFGLGDVNLGGGAYTYWAQYHNGEYNQLTLGYYTGGGVFDIIRLTSNSDGTVVTPGGDDNDKPTTPPVDEGETVVGETTTEKKPDGTVVEKTPETTTYKDGSVKEKETTKETSKDGNSVVKTESSVSKDKDGNETKSEISINAEDKTTGLKTDATVIKDKDGNETSEIKTEVKTESSKDESGKLTAEVDEVIIEKAVKQATDVLDRVKKHTETDVKPVVDIKIESNDKDLKSAAASIPKSAIAAIKDADVEVKVSTEVGSVTLSTEVLSKMTETEGEDVSISTGKVDKEELNDRQKEKVGDRPIFEFSASVGDNKIHDLGGKAKLVLPYELKEGEDSSKISIWYLDDNGNIEAFNCVYDEKTKSVSFETEHFSVYTIMYDVSAPSSGGDVLPIVIGVIIALLVVGAAAFVYLKSKRE